MGHLLRCQTLALASKSAGHEVDFYVDTDRDYRYLFPDYQCFTWSDVTLTNQYDVIVVDSYEAASPIYTKLSELCQLLVAIDDYCRIDYPAQMIINFAVDAPKRFTDAKRSGVTYLLGLDYVPIRPSFFGGHTPQDSVFIMLGGSDPQRLSARIIESLANTAIHKVVVINNAHYQEIQPNEQLTVLHQPSDEVLLHHMKRARYAISTASMTLYELSFLRIPTIIIAVSENQRLGVQQMVTHQLAADAVDVTQQDWPDTLQQSLHTLMQQAPPLAPRIDGKGAQRILRTIEEELCR